MIKEDSEIVKAKLNMETSRLPWKELQRFFASGVVLGVDTRLDLVEVGYQLSRDNKQQVEQWLAKGLLSQVKDRQAIDWYQQDAQLWALVVRPWVLVQDRA